jgi:hypothetical protein
MREILRRLEEATDAPLATITVRVVDGAQARAQDQAFAVGGHHEVYPWIPKDEVWIEQGSAGPDRTAILVHELVEWALMRWDGLAYDKAHRLANAAEEAVRLRVGAKDGETRSAPAGRAAGDGK